MAGQESPCKLRVLPRSDPFCPLEPKARRLPLSQVTQLSQFSYVPPLSGNTACPRPRRPPSAAPGGGLGGLCDSKEGDGKDRRNWASSEKQFGLSMVLLYKFCTTSAQTPLTRANWPAASEDQQPPCAAAAAVPSRCSRSTS